MSIYRSKSKTRDSNFSYPPSDISDIFRRLSQEEISKLIATDIPSVSTEQLFFNRKVYELDTSECHCPFDYLRTKDALEKLDDRDILNVISRNPLIQATAHDLTMLCKHKDHKLIQKTINNNELSMLIQKNAGYEEHI